MNVHFLNARSSGTLWLFVACVAVVAGCKPGEAQKAKGDADTIPTRVVRLATVTRGDVVERVELTGELRGSDEVGVYPQLSERIVSLHVKEGDEVKAGALLAVLQGDLLTAGENQAQAGLDAAKANLAAVEDNLRRTRGLAEAGAIAPSQLEALESQKLAGEAQVRQLTAAASQASSQRGRVRITSPIAGYVTGLVARPGDMTNPGMPLLTVVKQDKVKAILRVPERDFLRVEVGMPTSIAPLARPDLVVRGEVSLRGPVVDRNTRTGLVEVHLDNHNGALLAGSSIRGVIEFGRRQDVVLVPAEAVLFTTETATNGKATVFVANDTHARRVEVTVGVRQGGSLEVVRGLEGGERIVVQGASFLRDGNPITTPDDTAGKGATVGTQEVAR